MTQARAHRGVTLIELLIAGVVAAIVLVAIFGAVHAQQSAYYEGQRTRVAQASARNAVLFMEQKLQLAGLGMAPSLAFDFDRYITGPCPTATMGTCPRDSIASSDELVFHARNPNYWFPAPAAASPEPRGQAWLVKDVTESGVKVTMARTGDRFRVGEVLQAVCSGGALYAYFTVGTAVGTLAADVADQVIPLASHSSADPFHRQDAATDGCFRDGTAHLFRIDRYRFHVRPIASATGYDPYLVLDRGISGDGSGTVGENDELIVAAGIESLQAAYGFANGTVAGATSGAAITLVAGDTGATGVTNQITTLSFPGPAPESGQSIYTPTSFFRFPVGPPLPADSPRLTDHQANIRFVRIAVVARSPEPDRLTASVRPILPLNQSSAPAWVSAGLADPRDGYQRVSVESTVSLPNMLVRGMIYY